MKVDLAIIGNGGAAAEAVLALRSNGYPGDIHLFADNQHAPYNPMLGTYLVAGTIGPDRVFPFGDERAFYGANQVTAHLGEAVDSLDARDQVITTASGSAYHYERCLVASGARPSVPPVPGLREALARSSRSRSERPGAGAEERRVFVFRSLADALDLKQAIAVLRSQGSGTPKAAVIGASLAGVKIATVLHHMGLGVCLVEKEPCILPLSAHPDCARLMEERLSRRGFDLVVGAGLAAVEASRSSVRLSFEGAAGPTASGPLGASVSHRDVEVVVVCTGSRPALDFLVPGQIDVGAGIAVDEELRSSLPTLFAAGDVAEGKNLLTGRREIIGLWASARYQGRAAGRVLAGAPALYGGGIPHNITHVDDMLFASVGCTREYDEITTRSEGDSFQLRAWQNGRLVGVNLLNCCHSAGAVKQALLRAAQGAAIEWEASWTSFSA